MRDPQHHSYQGFGLSDLRGQLQRALGDAFTLERELGGGGMSRVFVARDQSLGRDVVVKVLSAESTAGLSADRFRREIQTMAQLQHPHIVSIISAGEAEGSLFYVMPYVQGETLRERLARDGKFPIAEVMRLLREILDALAFAHQRGLVHRDIKPENILLEAGHALIADFGIAKALAAGSQPEHPEAPEAAATLTQVGIALGTPTYMAPEQAAADPTTDHRADLYAVGILAYELLTGKPPFTGSAQQIVVAHLTTPVPAIQEQRAEVPQGLATMIGRALEKEPANRPQSAREMVTALDTLATPSGTASSPKPKRRLWPVATFALLLLIALGIRALMTTEPPAPLVDGGELIAVMPLSAVSDTSLQRLGQDLVVTLSANLDGVGALRTVDAATLLLRAKSAPSPLPLGEARTIGKELGARSVLTGTLISEGAQVRASVVLYLVEGDSALARATALAMPAEIGALTDSLSWEVLRQVWRRGEAPSPVLAGLTTSSFEALRSFLDAERSYQGLEVKKALEQYRRAFEIDSNFAQAYLRYNLARQWQLEPEDPVAHARMLALVDRLPERDRVWVEISESDIPVQEKVRAWEAANRRFPDYPPILMAAADLIIHNGPLYGIPLEKAVPLIDRLAELTPNNADVRFHQSVTKSVAGTLPEAADAMERAANHASGEWLPVFRWYAGVMRAGATGGPHPAAPEFLAAAKGIQAFAGTNPALSVFSGFLGLPVSLIGSGYGDRLAVIDELHRAKAYSPALDRAMAFGKGTIQAGRGEWDAGIRTLATLEDPAFPPSVQISSARAAVLGAWLGAVDTVAADGVVQRVRRTIGNLPNGVDRTELEWIEGLMGVMRKDEARVRSATRTLRTDTSRVAQRTAASLDALWLHGSQPEAGVKALKGLTDQVMREGGYVSSPEVVSRFLIGRDLVRRGNAAEAEQYLMWTDAMVNTPQRAAAMVTMKALVAYERGVAFEAAGNPVAAAKQLGNFLRGYDHPPAAHQALVDDATQRLAALRGDAAAKPALVPPKAP